MSSVAPSTSEGERNYQFLAGLSLGILYFLQMQLDQQVLDVLIQRALLVITGSMLAIGALGLVLRRAVSPLAVLVLLGTNVFLHYQGQQGGGLVHPRPPTLLQPLDLSLCMATLAYVAAHYRLNTLRFHAVPADARVQAIEGATQARSAHLATQGEFLGLLAQIPLFALLAQGLWYALSAHREIAKLQPEGVRFLTLVWMLSLGLFVLSYLFRYWRRRQMDVTTARLLLQDVLWQETRGEQRRINRWLAWDKVRRQEALGPEKE
jgi:hypothetical protein